jgi:hypothetical protein
MKTLWILGLLIAIPAGIWLVHVWGAGTFVALMVLMYANNLSQPR